MKRIARAFVPFCFLAFVVALFPSAALASDGSMLGGQSLTIGAIERAETSIAPAPEPLEGELVEHTAHVALIQEGAVPTAAEAGTPWDGLAVGDDQAAAEGDQADVESGGSALSALATNGTDTAKSRILKALLDVRQGEIYLYDCNIPSNSISDLYASVVNSSPDLFYVDGSMSWSARSSDGNNYVTYSITPSYRYDTETIKNQMKPAYDSAFRDMLGWVPQGAGPIEKAKAIHDWLVRNCAYNTDAANQGYYSYPSKNPWEAYGALVDRRPVCQGYALAFKAAMNTLGVPCGYLTAHNHGWNIIQVNGSWFHVDATWDDPVPDGGFYSVHTEYFMKSDSKVLAVDRARGSYVHADWTQSYHAYDTTYDGWTTGWPSFSGQAAAGSLSVLTLNASSAWMLTEAEADLRISNLSAISYWVHRARWSSSNSGIVSVDSTGHVVSGSQIGVAVITCELGGLNASCTITVRRPLKDAEVTIPKRLYAHTGLAVKPSPKVVLDGVTLTRDRDYTVSYKNNVEAGKATLYVNGTGYYSGQWEIGFVIAPSLAKAKMSGIAPKTYAGRALKPSPKVTYGGKVLKKGVDYTLSYKNNKKAGTATVKAVGKGSYVGSISRTFRIAKAGNTARVASQSKKAMFKVSKRTRKLATVKTVALPKVTAKFGKATWKVVLKDKKRVLTLKSGKVKVRKGTRRGTYIMKLRASVKGTANYKGASTKTVTVKVRVK